MSTLYSQTLGCVFLPPQWTTVLDMTAPDSQYDGIFLFHICWDPGIQSPNSTPSLEPSASILSVHQCWCPSQWSFSLSFSIWQLLHPIEQHGLCTFPGTLCCSILLGTWTSLRRWITNLQLPYLPILVFLWLLLRSILWPVPGRHSKMTALGLRDLALCCSRFILLL